MPPERLFCPMRGSNIPDREEITASIAICPLPGTSFASLPIMRRNPKIITAAKIHVVNIEFVTGNPKMSKRRSPLTSAQNPSVANAVCAANAIAHVLKNLKFPIADIPQFKLSLLKILSIKR